MTVLHRDKPGDLLKGEEVAGVPLVTDSLNGMLSHSLQVSIELSSAFFVWC